MGIGPGLWVASKSPVCPCAIWVGSKSPGSPCAIECMVDRFLAPARLVPLCLSAVPALVGVVGLTGLPQEVSRRGLPEVHQRVAMHPPRRAAWGSTIAKERGDTCHTW